MSRLDDLATREEAIEMEDTKALAMEIWNRGFQVTSEGVVGSRRYTARISPRDECLPVWVGEGTDHDDALRNAYRAWQAPDQRPDAVTISDAMVERAAEKMWELATGETWLRIGWGGPAKPPYINDARAVLEAALAPETPDGQ